MGFDKNDIAVVSEAALLLNGLMARTTMKHEGDLTPTQAAVAFTLAGTGPLPMGRLADAAGIAPAQAARAMNALSETGLAARTHGESDRRSLVADLTDAGRAMVARQKSEADALLAEALKDLPKAELSRLIDATNICRDVLIPLLGREL